MKIYRETSLLAYNLLTTCKQVKLISECLLSDDCVGAKIEFEKKLEGRRRGWKEYGEKKEWEVLMGVERWGRGSTSERILR